MQSDELDELRQQDFEAHCQALEQDRTVELAYRWEREEDALSPVLQSMCNDLWISIQAQCARRAYHHSREWL